MHDYFSGRCGLLIIHAACKISYETACFNLICNLSDQYLYPVLIFGAVSHVVSLIVCSDILALSPGHSQILSRSHGCEIKSGSGLGTRLLIYIYIYQDVDCYMHKLYRNQ